MVWDATPATPVNKSKLPSKKVEKDPQCMELHWESAGGVHLQVCYNTWLCVFFYKAVVGSSSLMRL